MAAWSEAQYDRVIDLHQVSAAALSPLLDEEVAAWRDALDWDMRSSAGSVRRHMETQSLSGFALMDGAQPAGYCYYVRDGRKGLLGDLYVMAAKRTPTREYALLEASLDALWRTRGVDRVEAQLLLAGAAPTPSTLRKMPFSEWLRVYPRQYLEFPVSAVTTLPARDTAGITIKPWGEARQEDSARLVTAAYRGHIDSEINDQYRSPAGARRFLSNIVQYPGCGSFFAPASYMAVAGPTLCGISLASLVADQTGHITQLCVAPDQRGLGVGYALLRESLLAFAAHGCRRVSLTVTTANAGAIRLYQQAGFKLRREFSAFVWTP